MSKKYFLLMSALAVLFAAPRSAQGQTPTPEGTIIRDTASVSYTDANGNTYTTVKAGADVTVGFAGSIDVTGQASYAPASASTADTADFVVNNLGNGVDSVTIATAASGGLTITGYKVGANSYATLSALNDALAADAIALITGTRTIRVIYDVAANLGGSTQTIQLTATSRRDNAKADSVTTNILPPISNNTVTVTATPTTSSRLPNGSVAAYTASFSVANGSNAARTYAVAGSVSGTATTIVSVNGGTSFFTVPAASSASLDVTYTVGDVAAGQTGTVILTATDTTDALVTDADTLVVTVVRPALTMTKEAFRADSVTAVTGTVLPGETIIYKLTITNTGSTDASGVSVTDPLPAEVTYVSSGTTAAGWTVSELSGTITAALTGTMPNTGLGSSVVVWIRVTVK
jgi:uncharacterized repeat protein (TIGR01451 family)